MQRKAAIRTRIYKTKAKLLHATSCCNTTLTGILVASGSSPTPNTKVAYVNARLGHSANHSRCPSESHIPICSLKSFVNLNPTTALSMIPVRGFEGTKRLNDCNLTVPSKGHSECIHRRCTTVWLVVWLAFSTATDYWKLYCTYKTTWANGPCSTMEHEIELYILSSQSSHSTMQHKKEHCILSFNSTTEHKMEQYALSFRSS